MIYYTKQTLSYQLNQYNSLLINIIQMHAIIDFNTYKFSILAS